MMSEVSEPDPKIPAIDDSTALTAGDIFQPTGLASVRLTDRAPLNALLADAGLHDLTRASPAEDLRDALESLNGAVGAACLDATDRATLIKLVLDTLAERKIKHAHPVVRATLADRAPAKPKASHAGLITTLADDEPAAAPVNGAALLDDTATIIRRHVILSPPQADAIALWIAAAYVIDALVLMPILLVTAPTMRSGKTTLLTLLGALVPRALAASNLTGAVLARAIATFRPTLLADEADTWLTNDASELRGIMNAGHTRATAYVLRCAPDSHEPTLIPCFGPRVIAMIRRPPATIADRSIAIDLRRKRPDESVTRFRLDRLQDQHGGVRRQWRRWATDHEDAIRDTDPSIPAELNDRAADNWRPLLGIADLIQGDWPGRARAAARKLSSEPELDDSTSVALLHDVRAVFEAAGAVTMLPSAALTEALVAMPDCPWAEWSSGRPMTAIKLAARLKPFGLRPRKVRVGPRTVNAYVMADFLDAWARYLPTNSEQSEQPHDSGRCSDLPDSEQTAHVPTPATRNESMFIESVPTVPTSAGGSRDEGDRWTLP
jgi:putative DNA primase/helicase